ncbi:MAG: hypothetical protein ACLGIJ_07460 [Candidatus Limnocylindria bacterium]
MEAVVISVVSRRIAALAVAAMLAGLVPSVGPGPLAAADDAPLERPMRDAWALPGAAEAAPRLLVVDDARPAPGAIRVRLLERDRVWVERSGADVAVVTPDHGGIRPVHGVGAPWMVPVAENAVAIIVSERIDTAVVVRVEVRDGPDGPSLHQGSPVSLPFRVDDAGVADVAGTGVASLVVASAQTRRSGSVCQGSVVVVLDPETLATTSTIDLPGWRIAGGVLGRFDEAPGDDLLAYAYPNCPAAPDRATEARVTSVRLSDGSLRVVARAAATTGFLGAPLRVGADDAPNDGVVARTSDGLAVLRPGASPDASWRSTVLGPADGWPLAVHDRGQVLARYAITWLAPGSDGDAAVRATDLGELDADPRGPFILSADALPWQDVGTTRFDRVVEAVEDGARTGRPPVGWVGDIGGDGCVVVLVPAARLGCDGASIGSGATWIGARPLAVVGDRNDRQLLVAGGLGWEEARLPATPTPAATGVAGWWRHGPSEPFALNELRAADATDIRAFPVARATIDGVVVPSGTVDIRGFTGTRLFARIVPAEPDAGDVVTPAADDLRRVATGSDERRVVARVPVAPGLEAGRELGLARIDLAPTRADPGPWRVTAVPIDVLGEVGRPVSGIVVSDVEPPTVRGPAPFTSPVWPAETVLAGETEPGTTVVVEGIGPIEVDRRGRFSIRGALAPWPQSFRVTVTDVAGNVTAQEVSVVGGIDYRQIPLEAVLAALLVVAVVVSGIRGVRRPAGSPGVIDAADAAMRPGGDATGPVIEELRSGPVD